MVRVEQTMPGTCSKLNDKWRGPYKIIKVLQDGLAYILKKPYSDRIIQRAAEKVRPFNGSEEWVVRMDEVVEPSTEEEDEQLPPRVRKAPKRFIEEV